MKMTYHLRTKKDPKLKILLVFLFILLLLGGFRLLAPRLWSAFAVNSARPFLTISKDVSSLAFRAWDAITWSNGQKIEVSNLNEHIQELEVRLNDRDALERENQILRDMVGRNDRRDTILGIVLSKPTFTPYDSFLIDVGSGKGIKQNDVVLAGNNTAIGVVTEVYESMSKVTAYSSPNSRRIVSIGDKHIQAEAIGLGNGNYKVVLPQGSEVKVGDAVIVPDIIPTVFGMVERVIQGDQPSFMSILFKAPINLSELYYVEIIK